jgi:alcohol dehydrogenase
MEIPEFRSPTRILYGAGALQRVSGLCRELGGSHVLIVSDRGIVEAGFFDRTRDILRREGFSVSLFDQFTENPNSRMAALGAEFAREQSADLLIGLGGGSSLDCAKAINFLLTNGGRMEDYKGYGKASKPMLAMIAIPTTAGTGSEVQSYALILDDRNRKMACGDPKAAFRAAILDPLLTVSQPRIVTAAAGYDAIGHAVETYVTTRRTEASQSFSIEGWRLLEHNYPTVLEEPGNLKARAAMQLGACFSGIAIENSMLGATHALANPLTELYGTTHGVAIALLLHHVVRWNMQVVAQLYDELIHLGRRGCATWGQTGPIWQCSRKRRFSSGPAPSIRAPSPETPPWGFTKLLSESTNPGILPRDSWQFPRGGIMSA